MTEPSKKFDTMNFQIVMEALDRELSHYRKRVGQIYFFGFFLEILILGGKEKIYLGNIGQNLTAGIYSFLFIIIFCIVALYGREYLRRISSLKDERNKMYKQCNNDHEFPSSKNHKVNELNTMSTVLLLLTIVGIGIFWINAIYSSNDISCNESIQKAANIENMKQN